MLLEQRETLERAIPPLAKRFGITPKRAWEIIENRNGSLEVLLLSRQEPKTRQKVNEWWRQYHSQFHLLGLGVFQKVASPAKLPEPTYDQLICLVYITNMLRAEQIAKTRIEIPERIEKPKLTLWQRFIKWIKRKWL